MKESFANEFKVDKPLKVQIDQKYRHFRSLIEETLKNKNILESQIGDVLTIQASIAYNIAEISRNHDREVSLEELVSSYVHMHVNRLIPSNQRLFELLMYDFLYRHYRSALAKHQL